MGLKSSCRREHHQLELDCCAFSQGHALKGAIGSHHGAPAYTGSALTLEITHTLGLQNPPWGGE
jgi:hypothetical protein